MKKNIGKTVILFIVFTLFFVAAFVHPVADVEIKSPDNHYLCDIKENNTIIRVLIEKDGKIAYEDTSLYELEMEQRSYPVNEYQIKDLVAMGLSERQASGLSVGEYLDYYYSQPITGDYVWLLMSVYGFTTEEIADFTNMDAENYIYSMNSSLYYSEDDRKSPYTQEVLDKVNALGISLTQFKTLMNMSFSIEEICNFTPNEALSYLGYYGG